MSPYVRKTAAHAIPKLYSLDPEQKDQLVEIIEKLLKDQTTVWQCSCLHYLTVVLLSAAVRVVLFGVAIVWFEEMWV